MRLVKAKISYYKIKKIIKHFCVDIEASKTAGLTGINRNTVNRYYNIFRTIIYEKQTNELRELLKGEIEIDESYFGPKRVRGNAVTKRGRGTHRQPVFGVFERNGRVYTEIVPNCKRKTLRPLILGKVDPKSIIYSDKWRGYDGLVDVGYDKHFRVSHRENEFSKNRIHINGIESFWSSTKRRLTKFNGVKINFDLHLKECEWRWDKTSDKLEKELTKMLNLFK
jgi:transposase